MKLNELTKIQKRSAKRLGRGHGSGKGKTSARGYNGQKAHENITPGFEGGQLRLIKRLPFRRGVGNPSHRQSAVGVNLSSLSALTEGTVVDKKVLLEHAIMKQSESNRNVKILGNGEITVALTFHLPVSKQAQAKIEKAGGTITS